jgi:hypothetical protein
MANLICMYRSGSFPLLQLLIEIQYKISGFVLQPIYQHYTNTATPYINIRVGAFFHTFDEDYAGGYDQYCAARVGWEAYLDEVCRTPEDMDPDEMAQDIARFERAKWRNVHQPKKQSYRTPTYRMLLDGDSFQPTRACPSIQMIRRLSNVSHDVRNDLAKLFWTRVHIACDYYDDLDAIALFLQDRPAVHAGIKSLHLRLSISLKDTLEKSAPAPTTFRK